MPKIIKVSRFGLTNCPSCLSHIQVASKLEETSCPFCGASLAEEVERSPLFGQGMQSLLAASKSGVMAASLVGLVSVVGCTGDGPLNSEESPYEESQNDYGIAVEWDMDYNRNNPVDMGADANSASDMLETADAGDMSGDQDSADMNGADMDSADMDGADMDSADMDGSDMSDADM